MLTLNTVLLIGTIEGLKLTYGERGTPQCSFTLIVHEEAAEGKTFRLFVPVDVFGKAAEATAEKVTEGDSALIDGKLRWRSWIDKKGERQGKLAVLAWQVEVAHITAAREA